MLSYRDIQKIVNSWSIQMRVTRLRNLNLLVHGLIHSRSGCLSAIVRTWPIGSRRHVHRLKRLHRFLKNRGWHPVSVSEVVAKMSFAYRPGGRRTQLVAIALDWTKVRQYPVLWAAMPRRRRALPLAHGVYHPNRLRHSQNKLERGMCTLVASWLPKDVQPLFLADAGFGRTEFIRWLQGHGFSFVIRLRPETMVRFRGRRCRLGDFDTVEGVPLLLTHVLYRARNPVKVHIVISRLGDKVWYLGTSFTHPKQAVAWYKKRFWIEEMFRDMKSLLGLRQAYLKDENRLSRLLAGYQIAYFILSAIGCYTPRRWHDRLASRPKLSIIWVALQSLTLFDKARHRKVWRRHIWPKLILQTG